MRQTVRRVLPIDHGAVPAEDPSDRVLDVRGGRQRARDAVLAAANIKNEPPAEQKRLTQAAVYRVLVTQEEFRVLLTWHIAGGDEPPHIICHVIDRKSIKYRFTQYL